jgi:multidrug efflux pump subunit AcrB
MSTAWGSSYVNDFIDRGRVKRSMCRARSAADAAPEDFESWYVRNARGEMVPVLGVCHGHWTFGSPKLERYNGVPPVQIQGEPAPGYSSGAAMAADGPHCQPAA